MKSGFVAFRSLGDVTLYACAEAPGIAQAAFDMIDVCGAIHRNEAFTVPARHVQASQVSGQISKSGLMAVDRAHAKIQAEIDKLAKLTDKPLPPADLRAETRAAEIRGALARLSESERRRAISAAIVEGDNELVSAVLNGSRVTMQITPSEREDCRERWRRTAYRVECQRLDTYEKAQAALRLGGSILMGASLKCYDARAADAAEASNRAAKDALAKALAGA